MSTLLVGHSVKCKREYENGSQKLRNRQLQSRNARFGEINYMADDLYHVNLQSVPGISLYRLIHEFTSMERPSGDRPREGYLLDYKEDVSDRFLRSVAAFANTFGGLLIVGVTEKDGRPDKLAGVS